MSGNFLSYLIIDGYFGLKFSKVFKIIKNNYFRETDKYR